MVTIRLSYPTHGRGAWTGVGGTLSADGTGPGMYYRAPAGKAQMPGLVASRALVAGDIVDINTYAVYKAVQAIQREVNVAEDGLYGTDTAAAVKTWQDHEGLATDGIFGPISAKVMFKPVAVKAARNLTTNSTLTRLTVGHIGFESSWDPGAVGYPDPRDLGIGQINGSAYPDLIPNFRLTPRLAVAFVANLVFDNLNAMVFNERDAIAAYNLGVAGARGWIIAGRPDIYKSKDVKAYIDGVQAASN